MIPGGGGRTLRKFKYRQRNRNVPLSPDSSPNSNVDWEAPYKKPVTWAIIRRRAGIILLLSAVFEGIGLFVIHRPLFGIHPLSVLFFLWIFPFLCKELEINSGASPYLVEVLFFWFYLMLLNDQQRNAVLLHYNEVLSKSYGLEMYLIIFLTTAQIFLTTSYIVSNARVISNTRIISIFIMSVAVVVGGGWLYWHFILW